MSGTNKTELKVYIWRLADFLVHHGRCMSVPELTEHLNRNELFAENGLPWRGRGTYKQVSVVSKWLLKQGLAEEAEKIQKAFVTKEGHRLYPKQEILSKYNLRACLRPSNDPRALVHKPSEKLRP